MFLTVSETISSVPATGSLADQIYRVWQGYEGGQVEDADVKRYVESIGADSITLLFGTDYADVEAVEFYDKFGGGALNDDARLVAVLINRRGRKVWDKLPNEGTLPDALREDLVEPDATPDPLCKDGEKQLCDLTRADMAKIKRVIRDAVRHHGRTTGVRGYDLFGAYTAEYGNPEYRPMVAYSGVKASYRDRHKILQIAVADLGYTIVDRHGYYWVTDTKDGLDPLKHANWLD